MKSHLSSASLTPVATPLPAALPLFATGLGGRRKRLLEPTRLGGVS
jgi:hypothetical protein